MAYLLDTNVLSELRKGKRCDPNVRRWAQSAIQARHFISVLSLGEIRRGIELLRRKSPGQCAAFERWLARLQTDYASNILPVTEEVTDCWGRLMAAQTLPVIDGLLAATAMVHHLTVVTRNTADFGVTNLPIINPFD